MMFKDDFEKICRFPFAKFLGFGYFFSLMVVNSVKGTIYFMFPLFACLAYTWHGVEESA